MTPNAGQTHQSIVVRPATLMDLRGALVIRQAQERAQGGEVITASDRLAGEWEALGERVGEQVWVAVTADNYIVAYVELVRSDHVFSIRSWSLPDRSDIGLALALLDKAEERACAMGREAGGGSLTLFSQAASTRPEMQQALAQSGFALLSTYEKMELALEEPPAAPENMPGIEVRSFATEQDAGPRATCEKQRQAQVV